MNIDKNKHYLQLPRFHREQLLLMQREYNLSGLSEEEFVSNKLANAGFVNLLGDKKVRANDGGVDYLLSIKNEFLFIQLKWWKEPIHEKLTKGIFGEMFLNKLCQEARESGHVINYALLTPFIGTKLKCKVSNFARDNFFIIANERFVQFMLNPCYFLNHNLKEY